jgi:hypothetical protein
MFALFTGLAAAQVGGTGQTQLTCNTNVTVTPALRGEGFTEQTGDITITCTGGAPIAPGSSIPLVNIQVFYNTTVTSRLLPVSNAPNASEALLLVDEPGSGLPGYGPSLSQQLCTTPSTGCPASVGNVAGSTFNTAVDGLPVSGVTSSTPAKNVYQGIVTGNSVTFFGVPAMPPATTGSRVYRITNVRVNAQTLAGGSASGASPVQASISISGATSLSIQNSTPNVGYVSLGLTTSAGSSSYNQCSSQTKQPLSILTFTENFGTAFKTRVNAASNTAYAGQINNPVQNTPGSIYQSESNFVFPISGGSQVAGLADFGTRLKATFNNIPAGATVFVSTANVNNFALAVAPPAVIGGSAANVGSVPYVGYAVLVNGENTNDGNAGGGFFPGVTPTDNGPNNGSVPIAAVSLSGGTGSAVWEVLNTNPNTIESLKFASYITYSSNVASNTPLPGESTVNLSFAPTATSGVASSTLSIPRFAGDSGAAKKVLTINICRTVLLYPFITNQAGFDTGVSIANTSMDPFGTGTQAGSCKLYYYGGTTSAPTTPPAVGDTGSIAAGTVYAQPISVIAPSFQGYMFAVCNFQYAHGFASVGDVGFRNLMTTYLALIIPDPAGFSSGRSASPACQGIAGCTNSGEQDAH